MGIRDKNAEDFRPAHQWLVLLLLCLIPTIVLAAPVINAPVSHPVSSKFGMRSIAEYNYQPRPHKGLDFATPAGTRIDLNTNPVVSMECTRQGDGTTGYGYYANVVRECEVMERFAHLTPGGCDASAHTILSGGSGIGRPHLHHEIFLGGARVDPAEAYGQDLCDPEVRRRLIESANAKLNGLAGSDGAVPPVSGDNDGATYVPPGGGGGTITDGWGNVITLPPGGGYTIITGPDGRITIVADPVPGQPPPPLTPGDEPDLTPNGETDNEVTGCAVDTWSAMVNQSVLQTRREMVINQTLITKPDSVMAYSCFTEFADRVRMDLGPIFSETKRWVNVEVDLWGRTTPVNKELGEYSLDGAIVNAALTPYESWMAANYSYAPLGGTSEGSAPGGDHADHGHGIDQAYTACGYQAQVWQMAKCKNPDAEPMFYRFEDLVANDPRQFPHQYACNYTGITQDHINIARGGQTRFDNVDLYYDILLPDADACAPPVQTGITVVKTVRDPAQPTARNVEYPDAVCLSPGCSYQREGTNAGTCVVQ